MTYSQLNKISEILTAGIEARTRINKAESTTSCYIEIFDDYCECTVRISNHGIPHKGKNGRVILPQYKNVFSDDLNINVPSMNISIDNLMPAILEVKVLVDECFK